MWALSKWKVNTYTSIGFLFARNFFQYSSTVAQKSCNYKKYNFYAQLANANMSTVVTIITSFINGEIQLNEKITKHHRGIAHYWTDIMKKKSIENRMEGVNIIADSK